MTAGRVHVGHSAFAGADLRPRTPALGSDWTPCPLPTPWSLLLLTRHLRGGLLGGLAGHGLADLAGAALALGGGRRAPGGAPPSRPAGAVLRLVRWSRREAQPRAARRVRRMSSSRALLVVQDAARPATTAAMAGSSWMRRRREPLGLGPAGAQRRVPQEVGGGQEQPQAVALGLAVALRPRRRPAAPAAPPGPCSSSQRSATTARTRTSPPGKPSGSARNAPGISREPAQQVGRVGLVIGLSP